MKNFKRFCIAPALATLGCASLFLTACGSDGGAGCFSLDEPFEIVLSKVNYEYKSRDSILVLKKPECKESSLGYLVWKKESDSKDTLEVNVKKSTVRLRESKELGWTEYKFEGSSFPQGLLYDGSESREPFRYATRIDGKQMKQVFLYDGNDLMKSYQGVMFDGNDAVENADRSLVKFYSKFSENGKAGEKQIADDVRVPSKDKLTLFNGDVSIKVDYLDESSGKIVLKFDKADECPIKFKIRYANEESDCSAAYDDFTMEKTEGEKFDFNKYSMSIEYSTYCVERLVLEFKKDKGILTKQAPAVSEKILASKVARAAVDAILKDLGK